MYIKDNGHISIRDASFGMHGWLRFKGMHWLKVTSWLKVTNAMNIVVSISHD